MLDHKGNYSLFSHFFVYGLGFLLLWEWLRTVPELTNTGSIQLFVLFVAFSFLVTYLQLPIWLSVPIKIISALYCIHILFFDGSFFSLEWTILFGMGIAENIEMLFAGDIRSFTDPFRSLLFFFLLSILSYLIYYWIVIRRRGLLFFLLTILFITIVDTFSDYDASYSIIRVVIIGFLLLGTLRLLKLQEDKENASDSQSFSVRWIGTLSLILLVSSLLGFLAPKAEPQWPDPVPTFKEIVYGDSQTKKVGYSSYADYLGGGFEQDDQIVFTAEAKREHYWRGESMDFYTGKGWESTENTQENQEVDLYRSHVEVERLETKISMAEGMEYSHIFYPGQFIFIGTQGRNLYPLTNVNTGKVSIYEDGQQLTLKDYTVVYDFPKFSLDALRKSSEEDPTEITDMYLQLPENLPSRIEELAIAITDNHDNRYDKAKAIERYFFHNQFLYETVNVPRPADQQDYVDQFLFETKQGYCDNYSSAMAVLLRSIDIPTRWVRGFTAGDVIDTKNDETKVYQVTNENAHSWVEVYFPDIGWVPFEPTIGYENTAEIVNDVEEEIGGTEQEDIENELAKEQETIEESLEKNKEENSDEQKDYSDFEYTFPTFDRPFMINMIPYLLLVIVISYVSVICFKNRKKILSWLYYFHYQDRSDDCAFEEAYHVLLKLLKRHGFQRHSVETLREFADRVDQTFQSTDMKELTLAYEKVCYGGGCSVHMWNEMKPLWENLIKRMSS